MNNNSFKDKKLRLAVIPNDPLEAYKKKGTSSWLESYYNPDKFFDEVYLLSPLETEERYEFGMNIIPITQKKFKKRIKDLKIDIIRAYGGNRACDIVCNNKVKGIPVVVSVHDTNPDIIHDSVKKADIVFCVSEAVKELVLTKFKQPDRIWLLPNRIDFSVMHPYSEHDFENLKKEYDFKYKILHVGRKTDQKNLDTLIKALKILGTDYCLITIGRGDIEKYSLLAYEEDVIERCYFIESVENPELAKYYSWADCMCTPSRWEGFGLVFIEALACESIVITSDIAPMNEYIRNLENGLLIKEYENPQSIAKMISLACEDKKLRESLKKNTRKSVEQFEKKRIDKLEANYYAKILSMNYEKKFNKSFWAEFRMID